MELINISSNNKALNFINTRIKSENYRGKHLSQHNRYSINQIYEILILFNKYCPNKEKMTIRTADISKRFTNNEDEIVYANFCNDVKEQCGIGTQDAMRKNLFVDLTRMGLLERFGSKQQQLDPYKRSKVKYVALSSLGHRFINEENKLNQYFIFSKAINQLLNGQVDIILDIMMDKSYKINSIDLYEHMLIVSAVDCGLSFNISKNDAVDLIKSYRALSTVQRRAVIDTLKIILQPSNYKGNKTKKRDFHNWINESQQIYNLLEQTVYFEKYSETDKLVLRQGKEDFDKNNFKLKRSQAEKNEYFKQHKIERRIGFELHHVVPLGWSENSHHFKLLDTWKNMVYIDGYSHAKITQNRNRNVVLELDQENIKLSDYHGNVVYLNKLENIDYSIIHQMLMKTYNAELLKLTY